MWIAETSQEFSALSLQFWKIGALALVIFKKSKIVREQSRTTLNGVMLVFRQFGVRSPSPMWPPLPHFVPRNHRRRPVGKPHISTPARHHFIALITKQPFGTAAGVIENLIAVPIAVVVDATEAAHIKVVSPHIGGDFRNLRRFAATSGKPYLSAHPIVQQAGKSRHPLPLDNSAHVVITRLKSEAFNRITIAPLFVKPPVKVRRR